MATIQCTVQRSGWYEVYFEYSYTQDTTNAKSTVSHSLKLKQLTNGYDFDTVGSVTVGYKVAGTTFSKTGRINIDDVGNAGYTITLASGSSTIQHDTSTGKGSFTVSVDTSIDSGGWGPGTIDLSDTVTLPTIARASVPTVSSSSVKMKNSVTINTNRASTSFTHTLKYTFGGATATIATGVGASYSWTVPDLAAKCNNATRGTATITCITYNGSTTVGTKTCTLTLTVPDASDPSLSASTVSMGNSIVVYSERESTAFKHTMEFWFAGVNISTQTGVGYSAEFNISLDLAKKIPSAPSGTGTIICTTYNGTAKVGNAKTVTFKATVPNNTATQPSCSFTLAPTGSVPTDFAGLYIQGKTGVKADFTASSTYSTIASYKMSVDGKTYTGDPATSNVLTVADDITVTGTVTDSRGYYRQISKTITVHPYSKPTLLDIVCERSLQDKTYDDSGTYLHIKAKRSYAPVTIDGVQKNFCYLRYRYKTEGGSWSSEVTLLSGSNLSTDTYDVAIPDIVTQVDKSYSVQLIVTDTIGGTNTYDFSIPTAQVTLHLAEGGCGAAVGKYSEATADNKMFEVAEDWNLVIGGEAVTDFVVEQGTSGNWSYRKWESGNCDLYTYHKSEIAIDIQQGGVYRSEVVTVQLPFTVYEITPVVDCCDISVWASTNTYRLSTGNTSITYALFRGVTYPSYTWYTHIHIKGRWK